MGIIRPATPGFLVTLVATGLLAVVSFCVPYFKSVYFLKASITVENVSGSITFGTLGYCLELPGNTTCSKPSIGYELDINSLVGNNLPIQIPEVAVKWITYALFSHVVALALAAGSSVFGLLAHVREMTMTCCSICISGFAAGVALIAFIFDLVLFFVAKSRINAVGTAEMGNAIWLTLAAWILLFFSGCFYSIGRCCVSRRPKGQDKENRGPDKDYSEQMRLDAVKADADRKARERQQKELGLPAFAETQPLTARVDGDHVYIDDDTKGGLLNGPPSPTMSRPSKSSLTSANSNGPRYATGGYVRGAPGTTAMDEYYNPAGPAEPNTYPPQPQRQGSQHAFAAGGYNNGGYSSPQRQQSGYAPSASGPYAHTGYGAYQSTSPPPMPSQSLAVPGQYVDPYAQDPYNQSGQQYGHAAGGSSYHTASSHNQQPSGYSQYDPYAQTTSPPPQNYYSPQPHQYSEQPRFVASPPPDAFAGATGYGQPISPPQNNYGVPAALVAGGAQQPPPPSVTPAVSLHSVSSHYHQSQQAPPVPQPQRQYTVGGEGYGANTLPPLQEHSDPYGGYSSGPPGIDNSAAYGGQRQVPDELPPSYDQGNTAATGNWGKR
ncbi:pali-domain-containing protein [Coprinopsis marcescibilis]|uniref:Pali-domain-containing protein n=1 Tax=Coprinopsis marcescibilis TaxID=230819 RepID=A0A5C3L2L0_COPMA|nr:pali-domain-containing protein [Coprinopsis marcescibilis]